MIKGEGKIFIVHTVKTCEGVGSRGIAPLIFNFGTRWRRVVIFTPWPPYPPEKNPRAY